MPTALIIRRGAEDYEGASRFWGKGGFGYGVVTVFNSDHDNSSKLGEGKEKEYIETNEGRPFAINGGKGRYVRFYSKGNTSNEMNHYTEVEVYGR